MVVDGPSSFTANHEPRTEQMMDVEPHTPGNLLQQMPHDLLQERIFFRLSVSVLLRTVAGSCKRLHTLVNESWEMYYK